MVFMTTNAHPLTVAPEGLLPLCADMATDLPQAVRLQRLVDLTRAQFNCGAVALLRLEEDRLRPVAVTGLVSDALGRRFAVGQHPRLAAILARREVTCFEHDSQLPDPYDGLLDTLVGEPLPVHDCMGVALHVEGRPWGVLTLDALTTGTFSPAARQRLARCVPMAEAVVRMARLEHELRTLRMAGTAATEGDDVLRAQDRAGAGEAEIVGESPALKRLLHELAVVATSDLPVLLLGETGVGKELFARLLHQQSGRRSRPMVHVNCAALPESLAESELFGHVRGAFSGAVSDRPGRIEAAEGGTLFLDEVAELPLPMQVKLLRAIQERTIVRVGAETPIAVSIRLVCATHQDLKKMVEAGRFREDLYYRIHVVHLHIPPLRERKDDIRWLARRLLEARAVDGDHASASPRSLSRAAEQALLDYPWPGNIRELKHCLERACILSTKPVLSAETLFGPIGDGDHGEASPTEPIDSLNDYLQACERKYIEEALAIHNRRIGDTAASLGISRKNLWQKMKKLQITAADDDGETG